MSSWLKAFLCDGSFFKIPYYFNTEKDDAAQLFLSLYRERIESIWIEGEKYVSTSKSQDSSIGIMQDCIAGLTTEMLWETLEKTDGNQREAAKLLGFNEVKMGRIMKKYGINTRKSKYNTFQKRKSQ